jgi:hypothetical protein
MAKVLIDIGRREKLIVELRHVPGGLADGQAVAFLKAGLVGVCHRRISTLDKGAYALLYRCIYARSGTL